MAENDAFNVPTGMANRNAIFMDGLFAHVTSISPARPNSLNLNNQYQIMGEFPALSMLQGEPANNLHTGFPISNHVGLIDCSTSAPSEPLGRNTEVQERFVGGTPISASSIAAILAARCSPCDNMNELPSSAPSANPLEILKTPVSNDYSDSLNSAFATSINCGYDGLLGGINNKWAFDKFLACPEVAEVPGITDFQPFQLMGNVRVNANGWTSLDNANLSSDNLSSSSKFSNELSLSLATSCQPSIIRGTSIPDQFSEISCSGVTHRPLNKRQFGSESSCNSKKLSLGIDSRGSVQISQFLSGSRYLLVIQEILTEIASYSLENLDQMNYPASRNAKFSLSSSGYALLGSEGEGRCGPQTDPVLREREVEAKKKQLLALLQEVDEQYNQCLDEIHTVVSAFHAATELDPHIHARFALQTISSLYKSLRERISNQILTMGGFFNQGDNREEERSFETSFIQKQWALQQLRRKDHQLWRPQRGLPERSVSVLRAWMFQNFLHPYPKDTEKHLLAVKSGLTRSQVSNWFINARVRLWKPMIEEMYVEMNRRKGRRNDEETNNNHRTHLSIDHQRFNKK
ncbi:homeobox protein ATH1 [Actinidia rufa]|uniref:Homeobox protein ATH1 n=1 Tax=Actinidia rufa TaxID=165716 RepID=A0A7J0GCM6_9ERIC|nr:homeobox protein ATH1 [Actinidia rufa]